MSRLNIFGWILMAGGLLLWCWGYFFGAEPTLIDWKGIAPWWIADALPNLETEAGCAAMLVAMIPAYWPKQ